VFTGQIFTDEGSIGISFFDDGHVEVEVKFWAMQK